jgi:hypothetical protein
MCANVDGKLIARCTKIDHQQSSRRHGRGASVAGGEAPQPVPISEPLRGARGGALPEEAALGEGRGEVERALDGAPPA